jgi:hypothetical protein
MKLVCFRAASGASLPFEKNDAAIGAGKNDRRDQTFRSRSYDRRIVAFHTQTPAHIHALIARARFPARLNLF